MERRGAAVAAADFEGDGARRDGLDGFGISVPFRRGHNRRNSSVDDGNQRKIRFWRWWPGVFLDQPQLTGSTPMSSFTFVCSRRIVTIQFQIPGDISSTDISRRQGEIWIGGTTGSRGFPASTTAAYRRSSTGWFPGWRPNRTPTRSCDASDKRRDAVRRNELCPGLGLPFWLAGAKSACTRDYARGVGPVEVLSVLRRYQLGSRHRFTSVGPGVSC